MQDVFNCKERTANSKLLGLNESKISETNEKVSTPEENLMKKRFLFQRRR